MKPLLLEVQGFTAFRERTRVDFAGRRLFAITGPTGAGKSSLLDAITWALYGQVPRVGNRTRQLVSLGELSMHVLLEFSSRGERYRVARRGPQTSARLERWDGKDWRPLADQAREVTEQVTQILGLDYATFTKTILLPQGAFDEFLKGDQSQRREIMTRLLGLELYEEIRARASERARTSKDRAEWLRSQLEQRTLATPEHIAELEAEQCAQTAESEALTTRRERLGGVGEAARAHLDAKKALDDAVARALAADDALKRANEAVTAGERAVAAAVKDRDAQVAARVSLGYDAQAHRDLTRRVALLDARERAERDLAEARKRLAAAEQAEAAAKDVATLTAKALDRTMKDAAAATNAIEAARGALSKAAGRAQRACARLADEVASAAREQEEAAAAIATAEARTTALNALREQAKTVARDLDRATKEVAASEASLKSAETAEARAAKAREKADRDLATARHRLDAARLDDAAASIQRSLKPGDRCPVCGDIVKQLALHVAPDLDAAEAAVTAADAALRQTARAHEQASAAAAGARAGHGAAVNALREVESSSGDLDRRCAEAGVERGGIEPAIAALATEIEAARERRATAARAAEERGKAERALAMLLAGLPRGVEPAAGRGDDADPAPLQAALGEHAAAGEAATEATEAERAAREAAREATAHLERCAEARDTAARDATRAEQSLAEHAGGDEDPAALRKAHAEAERLAAEDARLLEAVQAAERALAAATAAREARVEERGRSEAAAVECAKVREAAEEASRAARASFATAWGDVIGEGEPDERHLARLIRDADARVREVAEALGAKKTAIEHARKDLEQAARLREEIAAHESAHALANELDLELRGNRFIAYVQREAMAVLARDASERLRQFTSDRYDLCIENDEFHVVDRLNAEERRSVKTLSGGETFLASLALALALSEHLPQLAGHGGAVSLESLFLDEGFGSLDADSLDLAVQGLESLAGGNRMIAVISHVAELAERLPDRIEVIKRGQSSTVQV